MHLLHGWPGSNSTHRTLHALHAWHTRAGGGIAFAVETETSAIPQIVPRAEYNCHTWSTNIPALIGQRAQNHSVVQLLLDGPRRRRPRPNVNAKDRHRLLEHVRHPIGVPFILYAQAPTACYPTIDPGSEERKAQSAACPSWTMNLRL